MSDTGKGLFYSNSYKLLLEILLDCLCGFQYTMFYKRSLSWSRVRVKGHMIVVFEIDYSKVALEIEGGSETDL